MLWESCRHFFRQYRFFKFWNNLFNALFSFILLRWDCKLSCTLTGQLLIEFYFILFILAIILLKIDPPVYTHCVYKDCLSLKFTSQFFVVNIYIDLFLFSKFLIIAVMCCFYQCLISPHYMLLHMLQIHYSIYLCRYACVLEVA